MCHSSSQFPTPQPEPSTAFLTSVNGEPCLPGAHTKIFGIILSSSLSTHTHPITTTTTSQLALPSKSTLHLPTHHHTTTPSGPILHLICWDASKAVSCFQSLNSVARVVLFHVNQVVEFLRFVWLPNSHKKGKPRLLTWPKKFLV
jgi:hypothetical protein